MKCDPEEPGSRTVWSHKLMKFIKFDLCHGFMESIETIKYNLIKSQMIGRYAQGDSLNPYLKVICQEKNVSHFSCVTIGSSKTIVATFFVGGIMSYVYTIQAEYLQISCIFCWLKFYHQILKSNWVFFTCYHVLVKKQSCNIFLLGESWDMNILYTLNISKFGILISHDSLNEKCATMFLKSVW